MHLIADNYATHKHPKVKAWLKQNPRFHKQFTPTRSSWRNSVERFLADLTNKRAAATHISKRQSSASRVAAYVEDHNNHSKGFPRTAQADDALAKVHRARAIRDQGGNGR